MVEISEIISSIEEIEKQRSALEKEVQDLRIKAWQLQQELDKQTKEAEKWKEIAMSVQK